MRPRPSTALIAIGLVAALAGCAGREGGALGVTGGVNSDEEPAGTVVAVGDSTTASGAVVFFDPATVTIEVGDTVTWRWTGELFHTVTFDDGAPGADARNAGTFLRVFGTAGTFTYFCAVHGSAAMSGSVTVE